jgi:lipopolysaccharide export system ATP-binding protein
MAQPKLTVQDGQQGLLVKNIGKSYKKRPVLRDVSLRLNRGEVVALLGPNGAGKTTCFYTIAGLITPETGSVSVDGTDVTLLPMFRRARLGVGYLPQEASIFRGLSVEQNIRAILELSYKDRSKRNRMLEDLLAEFSIEHLRRAPSVSLSGGERRRVEIARCLAGRPSYVLLDEPFAGVDPIAVGDIRDLVARLKKRNIVDRAYILHDGKVLMSGTAKEVVGDANVRRVYLGDSFRI